ncbi:MAG TPA: hypothetical protein V6D27_13420 [Vampirovibrionales bacterium]
MRHSSISILTILVAAQTCEFGMGVFRGDRIGEKTRTRKGVGF